MDTIVQTTLVDGFKRLFATDVTTTNNFPVATTQEPSGDGVFVIGEGDGITSGANAALLAFFGTGSATQTATAKLVGWRKIDQLWVPIQFLSLNLALGSGAAVNHPDLQTGVGEILVDTITAVASLTMADEIVSPADGTLAYVKCDIIGCHKYQVVLSKGTATSINCLAGAF